MLQRVCLGPLKRLLHILLLLAALAAGWPRALLAADSPYAIDVWGSEDGVRPSSVIALTQTHDGFLWLGTFNGLLRFDGNSFTRFNVNNTPGLPDNRIVFLFQDGDQTLWVGTENANLCAIKNGVLKTFDISGIGGKVVSAYEQSSNVVWFLSQGGRCFRWNGSQMDLHPAEIPVPVLPQAFHLWVPGRDGVFWRLQNGQVEKWRNGRLEQSFGACPWPVTPVTGVIRGRGITFDAGINVATVDPAGNLVVGTTDSGVFWLDPTNGWRQFKTDQGLSHNTVLSLCFDPEGNLWVGTDGGGLNRIRRNYFVSPPEVHPWAAQSLAQDRRGGIWMAFNSRGLSYWLTNSVRDFGIGAGSNAWTVLVDNQQNVWAGSRGEGLFRFMSYYFQPVDGSEKIGRQIYVLYQTRDGTVWAGGENGLGCFDGKVWKYFSTNDGLPARAVRALAEDAQGILWIGTEGGGLFQMRSGKITAVNSPVADISCLLAGHDNGLWVGTFGHGLARYQNQKWHQYSTRNGLRTDSVGYLIEDASTNLWLGSYEGIMRVETHPFSGKSDGGAENISCRTFFTRECTVGAQPAALCARDGTLWFPTIRGIISVNPAELHRNTNPPPVVIESVRVDAVEQGTNPLSVTWNRPITLQPDNEQLEIHFASLNFSASKGDPFGTRFRYRLEGRDNNWTDIGNERVAHFQKLPPGNYTFHVQACNEDGVWNETGASLVVKVAPPFWRKPWFVASMVLCVLGILAGTIYSLSTAKLKRQLRAARQKELIEKERARIARDLHDQLGANLTQITLLGELAEVDKNVPEEIEQHAQQITETARDTTRSLDEIVWAVNPSNDTLEGLANYACKYAQEYFALAGVSYRAELPTQLPATPILPEVRHNVFLAFKEAVNNVVKHAHASVARVKLQLEPGKFKIIVTDNGRGLGDLSAKQLRNGLKNMRKRLADVHGEFEILPGASGGTVVQLTVPVATI